MREKKYLCKYCGSKTGLRGCVCDSCRHKEVYAVKFAEVRDDLREKLGLERLGAK